MIRVRVDLAEQIEELFKTTPKQARIVLWSAINRAAIAARTNASREIRKNYIIRAADVKSKIKIRKATANNLSATVRASGPVTPLMKFDVTQSLPVRARVKKGAKKPINHGFIVRMGNGHANVFTRLGKSRLPIQGRYGPSIAQMMDDDEIIQSIQERAQGVLDKRLEHDLNRLLGR